MLTPIVPQISASQIVTCSQGMIPYGSTISEFIPLLSSPPPSEVDKGPAAVGLLGVGLLGVKVSLMKTGERCRPGAKSSDEKNKPWLRLIKRVKIK